jgi:hypothetical protein
VIHVSIPSQNRMNSATRSRFSTAPSRYWINACSSSRPALPEDRLVFCFRRFYRNSERVDPGLQYMQICPQLRRGDTPGYFVDVPSNPSRTAAIDARSPRTLHARCSGWIPVHFGKSNGSLSNFRLRSGAHSDTAHLPCALQKSNLGKKDHSRCAVRAHRHGAPSAATGT